MAGTALSAAPEKGHWIARTADPGRRRRSVSPAERSSPQLRELAPAW